MYLVYIMGTTKWYRCVTHVGCIWIKYQPHDYSIKLFTNCWIKLCRLIHVPVICEKINQYMLKWPNSQIAQCTSPISHNAPFCSSNVHIWVTKKCAHFGYKIVHCGTFVQCIVGFVRLVYWNCFDKTCTCMSVFSFLPFLDIEIVMFIDIPQLIISQNWSECWLGVKVARHQIDGSV